MQNNTITSYETISTTRCSFKRRTNKALTAKVLNIKLPLKIVKEFVRKTRQSPEKIERNDNYDKFDIHNKINNNLNLTFSSGEGRTNYSFYVSNQNSTTNINYPRKSNIRRKISHNEEKRHVTFYYNNNEYTNKTFNPYEMKKTKSNYGFNRLNINDLYKDEPRDNIRDQQNKKNRGRRNLIEYPKYERTLIDKNHINKNVENGDDKEMNEGQYRGKEKKNINFKRFNSSVIKDYKGLNSDFFSYNYVKFSQATSVAGRKDGLLPKINQDSYICEKNVNGVLNFNIFGVMDGHGDNGHFASQFVSKFLLNRITNHPLIKNLHNPKKIYEQLKSNGYQIISNIFIDADTQILKEKFSCKRSGTTCVVVIQLEEHIICANAGDSRAIMIYDDKADDPNLINSKVFPLSYDCKPENQNERRRIYECGGTVERILDDNDKEAGPYRVWVKGEDFPGLAMSRSIGDVEAKTVGVIPNPQIMEYSITFKSKYLLVCSDGIWEFINNEEAMKIGNKYYIRNDPIGLCHELTDKSIKIWLKEDICIDDITVVTVFF